MQNITNLQCSVNGLFDNGLQKANLFQQQAELEVKCQQATRIQVHKQRVAYSTDTNCTSTSRKLYRKLNCEHQQNQLYLQFLHCTS